MLAIAVRRASPDERDDSARTPTGVPAPLFRHLRVQANSRIAQCSTPGFTAPYDLRGMRRYIGSMNDLLSVARAITRAERETTLCVLRARLEIATSNHLLARVANLHPALAPMRLPAASNQEPAARAIV